MQAITLTTGYHDRVALLTLNRPARHNAFDDALLQAMQALLKQIEASPDIRVVLLQATGKSFCAGADLDWMRRMLKFSYEENLDDATRLADLLHALHRLRPPTIALAQGPAYGGGVGLLACADMVIAAAHATFAFSETKLGLIPATIAPYVLQKIGAAASRYFLTAETFDAVTAQRLGLVDEVVAPRQLAETADRWVRRLLKNAPHALADTKALIRRCRPISEELRRKTAEWIASTRISEEAQAGMTAFLEKRSPPWLTGDDV